MSRRQVAIAGLVAAAIVSIVVVLSRTRSRQPPAPAMVVADPQDAVARVLRVVDADAPDADVPDAAPSEWCAQMASHNRDVLADVVRRRPACGEPNQLAALQTLRCDDGPHGGWGLRIERFTFDAPSHTGAPNACEPVGFVVHAIHRDATNRELSVFPDELREPWGGDAGVVTVNFSVIAFWGALAVTLERVVDLDGDGDPEAWLTGHAEDEGPNRTFSRVLTARGGTIQTFGPLRDIDVIDIVDHDRDGRWDILTRGPYASLEAESAIGGSYPVGPGAFLLHALPDGGRSAVDDVAQSRAKESCAGPPSPLEVDDRAEESVLRIVCARLWGASESNVMNSVRKRCKTFDDEVGEGHCSSAYPRAAAMAPPFTLR